MTNPRPLEDMSQEEQDKWLEENGFCKNGYIDCKSTDALNVLSFKDKSHNIPGTYSVPYEEVEDFLVQETSELEEILQEEQEEPKDDPLPAEMIRDTIRAALLELPGRQKEALELVILGGLTQTAAAEEMGISRQAVSKLISKGIRNLREYSEIIGGVDLQSVW
jgi:RNA polymerase sigma factor (sigma-70 family)